MAFHPYPQLIPWLFNASGFGPPRTIKYASTWPWVDHLVSGRLYATKRPVKTRFRYGSTAELLNLAAHSQSPDHYAKGTPSPHRFPKDPDMAPTACKRMVSGSISLSARSPFHLSLTVLVHYRSPESI